MRVVSTVRSIPQECYGWTPHELEELMRLYASQSCQRKVSWATAITDFGDPQFFLMDAESDCLIALSRLEHQYLLEDGQGCPLCVNTSLEDSVQRAQTVLAARRRPALMVRILVPIAALKAYFDEKCEALIPDSIELMLHLPAIV